MSTFQRQTDKRQARSLRAWLTENLKSYLAYCRRLEHDPGMHKEARRMYKQDQEAVEAELVRRRGSSWEEQV